MKSLREQLKAVKPKLLVSPSKPNPAVTSGGRTETAAASSDDWKEGVTPLDPKFQRSARPPHPTHASRRHAQTAHKSVLHERRCTVGCLADSAARQASRNAANELPVAIRKSPRQDHEPRPAKTSGAPSPSSAQRQIERRAAATQVPPRVLDPLGGRLLDLTEPQHFKEPEHWIDLGEKLQPPGGGAGRNLSVHIGLDFGTAFTKLAIRFADKVHFVTWEGLTRAPNPYFLPGQISRVADGYVFVGLAPHTTESWAGIKQPFLKPAPSSEARAAATAFLAWVLRYARAWLYRNHGALLRNRRVAWNVAIGCPTDAAQDTGIVLTYQQLAAAAWLLSHSPEGCSLDSASRALAEMKKPTAEAAQLDSLAVVPEFVAQIAGYARSAQRQRGLHFLVDIGAGTLDLATFNVERDGNDEYRDHYPILLSSVELLGTHFLMEARRAACGGALRWSNTGRTPDTTELTKALPAAAMQIRKADASFIDKACQRIKRVIEVTKGQRSPLSDVWQRGLPVFVAGGGASCDLYRQAMFEACARLSVRPIVMPLGLGDDAEASAVQETDSHRLTVAYGLTSNASVLARITASDQIPNFILGTRTRDRPDRDELYAR